MIFLEVIAYMAAWFSYENQAAIFLFKEVFAQWVETDYICLCLFGVWHCYYIKEQFNKKKWCCTNLGISKN